MCVCPGSPNWPNGGREFFELYLDHPKDPHFAWSWTPRMPPIYCMYVLCLRIFWTDIILHVYIDINIMQYDMSYYHDDHVWLLGPFLIVTCSRLHGTGTHPSHFYEDMLTSPKSNLRTFWISSLEEDSCFLVAERIWQRVLLANYRETNVFWGQTSHWFWLKYNGSSECPYYSWRRNRDVYIRSWTRKTVNVLSRIFFNNHEYKFKNHQSFSQVQSFQTASSHLLFVSSSPFSKKKSKTLPHMCVPILMADSRGLLKGVRSTLSCPCGYTPWN